MMDSAVNTFIKGLNRDVSPFKYSNENYFGANNIRIVTDESLGSFSITNEKGNSNSFNIPTTRAVYKVTFSDTRPSWRRLIINGISSTTGIQTWTYDTYCAFLKNAFAVQIASGQYQISTRGDGIYITGLDITTNYSVSGTSQYSDIVIRTLIPQLSIHHIIGSCQLRDYLIVFTNGFISNTDTSSYSSNGQIWCLQINEDGSVKDIGQSNNLVPSKHLKYNDQLNFSSEFRIEAYGNYETPEVGKVYFTDNNNNFRHFNILEADTFSIPLNKLDIIPDVQFGTTNIVSVTDTGNYDSGMVQYAHQYYNVHGSQSAFSPVSGLIHLTAKSESLSNTKRYFGSPTDTKTNKAVRLLITGLDRSFTNVRVVSLFYKTFSGTPIINIIEDRAVPADGTITVYDPGNISKGELSDIEFAALGSTDFRCKTFDVKDNILFPANITEEYYDVDEEGYWDSRAYRWDDSGRCILKDINDNTLSLSLISDCLTVPEDHDCIQSKTDQYKTYKYTKTQKRFGGEGTNIKYYFDVESLIEDDSSLTDPKDYYAKTTSSGYPNYANPLIHATKAGYMRNEVYRFGIIFKKTKGVKSFVKWIADILMPSNADIDTTTHTDGYIDFKLVHPTSEGITIQPLSVVFKVSNIPASAESFEIVRVKREDYDKSVLMQGLLFPARTPVSGMPDYVPYYEPYELSNFMGATAVMNFISPEINFYKTFSGLGNIHPIASVYHTDDNVSATYTRYHKGRAIEPAPLVGTSNNIITTPFVDARIVPPGEEARYTINNRPYRNYRYKNPGNSDDYRAGYMCTNLVLSVNTMYNNGNILKYGMLGTGYMLANLVRDLSSQYGGMSYNGRLGNTYQPCFQEVYGAQAAGSTTIRVYGGDTFINMFENMYGIYDLSLNETYNTQHHLVFPVESSINIALRHDASFMKTTSNTHSHLMQEFAGKHHDTVHDTDYVQDTDLYLYNKVYSRESSVSTFFSKPLNFSNNKIFDNRILSSAVKKTNEEIDSWTSFLATNYVDVDGTYGPINKLVTFNQKLLFFQDKGVGWASVNERSLITPDVTGTTMSLGKGGILDQYFYISRHGGSKHQFSVVHTPNGVYYYDALNNKINVFTGENNEPISELKGFSSYLKTLNPTGIRKYDKALSGIGVHGTYDPRFNRILWTFKDYEYADEFTIGFNEMLRVFESFYSFKPRIYMKFNDYIYSNNPMNLDNVYLHNSGNYGKFYDNTYDSEVEILVNKDPYRSKAFTNFEYILNTSPENAINFSSIQLKNAYQDSGIVLLTDSNSNRRNRVWRITAPRNYGGDDRIRGEYLLANFIFDNSLNNVKFNLSDIITHYMSNSL